jgi:Putative DNA-binding domain
LIQKRIDEIDKPTVDSLVTNSVSERRTLDYKELLPGAGDDDKREFLSDVASFANASGGDIVYGVADERDENGRATGIPRSAEGLRVTNIGEHKARLESSARDAIAPRIQGIQFQIVNGFTKGPVLIMRIPKSWTGPHMVTFKNLSRFYSRNSTGKYQFDVAEIRAAFIESTSIGEKLRSFRAERLAKAIEGETAVPLGDGVKMLLHVVPLSSMSLGMVRDVTAEASKLTELLRPIQDSSYTGRYNLDGFFVQGMRQTASYPGMPSYGSYVQVFRSGAIEAGEGSISSYDKMLPSLSIEKLILQATERFLDALKKMDTALPIFAMLTLIGVKGLQMAKGSLLYYEPGIIDRDLISLPEIVIEDFDIDVARLLQPMFDAMWQASGIERSPNYDENGNRTR